MNLDKRNKTQASNENQANEFDGDIIIRFEQAADIKAIYDVTAEAFLNAPHTEHTEQFIVQALRNAHALTISLVAERAGKVIAHVAVSPVEISDKSEHWYGLGPISVLPTEQAKGIGSLLMNAAIAELKIINAHGCVLLGEPAYYQRFGFNSLAGLTLEGVPAEYFMALHLDGAKPVGQVSYHQAFSATR